MSTKVKHGKIVRDSNGNRPRRFRMTNADIPIMVDAVFCGNPRKPGWVEMYVNGEGRKYVNALFPEASIRWTPVNEPGHGYDPAHIIDGMRDWEAFEMHLPDVAEQAGPNNLLPLNGDTPLGQLTQEQLASLLAISVKHQGGRAAWFRSDGGLAIVTPKVQ